MTTVTTWVVSQLDCLPQADGQTDVVVVAHWSCNGTDGTYNGSVYSTASFTYTGGAFVPYSSLTQDEVLGWIWSSGVSKDATEAAVAQQIANQVNPPIVVLPLPWLAP